MRFDKLIFLGTLLLLLGCDQYSNNQSKIKSFSFENKYKNSGFSLVYNDKLKIKKLLKKNHMLK